MFSRPKSLSWPKTFLGLKIRSKFRTKRKYVAAIFLCSLFFFCLKSFLVHEIFWKSISFWAKILIWPTQLGFRVWYSQLSLFLLGVVQLVSPQLVEWQLFEDISSYKCRFKENKFWQLYEERIFTNLLTISKITLSLTFIRRKLIFYHRYMAIWLS